MAEQIKTNRPYPIQLRLRDGHSATIRVMEPQDADKIIEFAKDLPADDLLFLRTDITDRNVVNSWGDAIKNGNTITTTVQPLQARMVGLHAARHARVALVRIRDQHHLGMHARGRQHESPTQPSNHR